MSIIFYRVTPFVCSKVCAEFALNWLWEQMLSEENVTDCYFILHLGKPQIQDGEMFVLSGKFKTPPSSPPPDAALIYG